MVFLDKYRVVISSILFVTGCYFLIILHNFSYYLILFFIIPLSFLKYKDIEIKFVFLFFLFFVSILINKFYNNNYPFYFNLLSFFVVFIFVSLKSHLEEKYINNEEMIEKTIADLKKEIDDIDSKIEYYNNYINKVKKELSIKNILISSIKNINSSKTPDEVIKNTLTSINQIFDKSQAEFIVSQMYSKIVADVFKTSTSVYIPSTSKDSRYPSNFFRESEKSIIFLPLFYFSKIVGVVKVSSGIDNYFTNDDYMICEMLLTIASVSLENISLYITTEEMARKDPLTGLFTRRVFDEKLDEEILVSARTKKPLSIIIFDIDHFKKINDNYGHQAGDEVLKKVAVTTMKNVREVDFVARYGGEEFVVILPHTSKLEAYNVAEGIRKAIKNLEFNFDNRILKVSVSIGICEFPSEATSKNQLIRIADERLYKAKNMGRDRIIYE